MSQNKDGRGKATPNTDKSSPTSKRDKKTAKAAVWGDDDDDYDSEEADQAFGLETENSMSGSAVRKNQGGDTDKDHHQGRNSAEVSRPCLHILSNGCCF